MSLGDIVGLLMHEEICSRDTIVKFQVQNREGGAQIICNGNGIGKEFTTPLTKLCKSKKIIDVSIFIDLDVG